MAKKKKNQSTQKIVNIVEASNVSPPYETASITSDTNDKIIKKKRDKDDDSHICKCNDKTKTRRPKTWKSITKLYGDVDTTEVWDGRGKDPERFFKPKLRKKEKQKLERLSENNGSDKNDRNNIKSKHPKKPKLVKKSVISFYRKRNRGKLDIPLKDKKINKNKRDNYSNDMRDIKKESPIIRFQVNRKPTHHHDGKGDSCVDGPCTKGLQSNYSQRGRNYIVDSQDKRETRKINRKKEIIEMKTEKTNAIQKSSVEKFKNMLSKCSFFRNVCKQSCLNKPQTFLDNSKGEPVFQMKIDSADMQILNTSEIKDKVRTLGQIRQNRACICPSRMKTLKKGRHKVCPKGICESNQTQFDCKCKLKNNLIVCKDTTCGLKTKNKKKRKKCKLCKSLKREDNKPAFKVVLDRSDMNILNINEVESIFKSASKYKICPSGICNVASKDPNVELRCRCISKKIIPRTMECTDETCITMKKCKLSDICSRLFSNSEYRVDNNKKDIKKQKLKAKSYTFNKKVSDNFTRQVNRQGDGWHETFCECDIKRTKGRKEKHKKVTGKKNNKSRKTQKNILPNMRCKTSKRSKEPIRQSSIKQYIMKCLQRKRVHCEKKLKEKEKEFKKNEKKAEKENIKKQKLLEKQNKIEEPQWNCLTKFVSGTLNLGINLLKGMFSMVFSLITNPIGSYVYVRERARDPPGTLRKISDWLYRTWSNKATKVSQTVKDSNTMNVIADQIEDSAFYDTLFANKGRTKAEKLLYEKKKRTRKRRIQKRYDQALYGCRHMLLTTMRKTPYLWFYHICPDMYPQCLSLVAFMTNFFHIIIYLLAFICWTPCIVSFELCRAFLCCFLCTG